MSFLPTFKPGHQIPMAITRRCPYCYRDARAQIGFPQGSMVVNFTRDFYLQCINRFCPHARYREPLPCFLKHRKYEVSDMVIDVHPEVGLPVEQVTVGHRRSATGRPVKAGFEIPNFEHPYFREKEPTVQRGPYRDCTGYLDWDDLTPSRDTWLRCNVCQARYHVAIFVERGVIRGASDVQPHFEEFRLEVDSLTGKSKRAVKASGQGARNLVPVPRDLAIFVDECRYEGRGIA